MLSQFCEGLLLRFFPLLILGFFFPLLNSAAISQTFLLVMTHFIPLPEVKDNWHSVLDYNVRNKGFYVIHLYDRQVTITFGLCERGE